MISKRQLVIGLLLPLLVFEVSCQKKQAAQKPKLPGPAEAPTLTQTLPYEIQPEPLPEPPPASATVGPPQDDQKAKSKKHARSTGKKPPPTSAGTQAKAAPATTTEPPPPNPGGETTTTAGLHPPGNPADAAAAMTIGPDVSSAEAARDRQSTNQSLDTTEKQLKSLEGRSLSSDEQAMLAQIRTFISQSRKAISEGDYERASNLAKKAQFLTVELMKK